MYKLKLLPSKEQFTLKASIKFPDVIKAKLQDKTVAPSKSVQEVIADNEYDGLNKVTVEKIPDKYIIPDGIKTIDVNGVYDIKEYSQVNVNIPEKKLGTKTITVNGTYKPIDDDLDGYSEVTVETSGVDINDYYDLTKRKRGNFISYIKQIPLIDTSDYTNMSYMFSSYASLTTIPLLDTNKVTNVNSMLFGCYLLTNLGGFTNLGQAYSTTQSANYGDYTLNLSSSTKLTHDSLMNVINNLYDIASKGCQPQSLQLGSTNLAKLTAEEVAIGTSKGWSIS